MSLGWILVILSTVLTVPFVLVWWWLADKWMDPKMQRFSHAAKKSDAEQVVVSTKDLNGESHSPESRAGSR